MVYIEERIETLESTVKKLQEQLEKTLDEVQAMNDKKRKLDTVSEEHLDKVVSDLQSSIEKKLSKEELTSAVMSEIEKAKEQDASLGKVVNEERLAKAVAGMQTALDVKVNHSVSRDQFVQSMQQLQQATAQKVSAQQLTQAIQTMQTALAQKVQEAVNGLQPLRAEFQRMQQFTAEVQMHHQWREVDMNDNGPFDTTKVYRLRIGDGAGSRWLYSNDVSMGHVYTSCNILDQSICVNATTKSSYAARKLGADVNTTAYFAVFQLQCKSG